MAERIIIAADDRGLALLVREALFRTDRHVDVVGRGSELVDRLGRASYDLLLLDLPDRTALEAIPRIRQIAPDTPIIVLANHAGREVALEATGWGAYDCLSQPLLVTEVQIVAARALEWRRLQGEVTLLRIGQLAGFEGIVGQSEAVKHAVEVAQRAAPTDFPVLIEGESGTGKAVFARAIHQRSARRVGPLMPVNVGAIPDGLLESELFGHERGAFTGAIRARPGRFELARDGTLFLDEIGDIPAVLQVKILRALRERQIERVGGVKRLGVDVRLIAATRRNMDELVAAGKVRGDVFAHLGGVRVRLPALRERLEDLPLLIPHLLDRAAQRLWRSAPGVSPEALRCLWKYRWPGNIRELQHVLEAAMVQADGLILPAHLPAVVQRGGAAAADTAPPTLAAGGSLDEVLAAWERRLIRQALDKVNGVQARAAKLLGVSERSLWYRVKKLKIQVRGTQEPPPR